MSNKMNIFDEVPETVAGDVYGKVEQCKMITRRDGTQNLRVDMYVTQDGNTWYKMTSWIPSQKETWIRYQFWASLGYTEEQMKEMTLRDDCAPWCTYLKLTIFHKGKYVNVKRYIKKTKNDFLPTPWHTDKDEKYGGVPYLLQPTSNPTPTANPVPNPAPAPEPAPIPEPAPAKLSESPKSTPKTSGYLKEQAIDLSWVTTENLIAELCRRKALAQNAKLEQAKQAEQAKDPEPEPEPTYNIDPNDLPFI